MLEIDPQLGANNSIKLFYSSIKQNNLAFRLIISMFPYQPYPNPYGHVPYAPSPTHYISPDQNYRIFVGVPFQVQGGLTLQQLEQKLNEKGIRVTKFYWRINNMEHMLSNLGLNMIQSQITPECTIYVTLAELQGVTDFKLEQKNVIEALQRDLAQCRSDNEILQEGFLNQMNIQEIFKIKEQRLQNEVSQLSEVLLKAEDTERKQKFEIAKLISELEYLQKKNEVLERQKKELQQELQEMSTRSKTSSTYLRPVQRDSLSQDDRLIERDRQIQQLAVENKKQRESFEQQISDLTHNHQHIIQKINLEIEDLKQKIVALEKQLQQSEKKIQGLQQENSSQEEQIKQKTKVEQTFRKRVQDEEQQIQKLQRELKLLKGDYENLTRRYELQNKQLEESQKQLIQFGSDLLTKKYEDERRQLDETLRRDQEERQRKENDYLAGQKKKQEELKQQRLLAEESRRRLQQERKEKARSWKNMVMDSHGKLECCFLSDSTGSMDEYVEQTHKSIQELMKSIKQQTNRDILWSCVAYQDFDGLQEKKEEIITTVVIEGETHTVKERRDPKFVHGRRDKYPEIDFTQKDQEITDFLKKVVCDGGDDYAEDIKGGILQMCKLKWARPFRLAILITDAPAHGKNWAGDGVTDDHKNEDLSVALDQMIEKNIKFLGFEFNVKTKFMFDQIEKYYKEKGKSDMFHRITLSENFKPGELQTHLIKFITEATVQITHSKNSATFQKIREQIQAKGSGGAIEALCKTMKNFHDFDKQGIPILDVKFKIHKAELNERDFEENIEDISRLSIKTSFITHLEGEWDCIRTKAPFAFGQMKAVYLMKKKGVDNELYVIKMPLSDETYASKEEALYECRSHLICQKLMRKMITELNEKKEDKYPDLPVLDLKYTDFLIMEEGPNKFWIAERFFSGNFVKYNNNFGYISDEKSTLNKLAQTFSYYSYVQSGYSFVVNDIQGVGLYFTDPAINSKLGEFDATDMGEEGIKMYEVSFEYEKVNFMEYLTVLEIND